MACKLCFMVIFDSILFVNKPLWIKKFAKEIAVARQQVKDGKVYSEEEVMLALGIGEPEIIKVTPAIQKKMDRVAELLKTRSPEEIDYLRRCKNSPHEEVFKWLNKGLKYRAAYEAKTGIRLTNQEVEKAIGRFEPK